MGTSLTGTKPKDTYDSLIKVGDNGPISGTAKYLSDGLGNDLPIAVSTSNVGIGTSSPTRPLTIQGPDNGEGQLRLQGTGSTTSYSEIGRESLSTGQFRIKLSRNGTVITPLVIDDTTGNVGIGTSSPTSALEMGSGLDIKVSTTGNLILGSSSQAIYKSSGADAISFNANAAERFRITANGVTFNGDTAAANALDDYEEGTFTGTLTPSTSGSITVDAGTQPFVYTKIGRQVTISGLAVISGVSSPVGVRVRLGGLPFTTANASNARGGGAVTFFDASASYAFTAVNGYYEPNQSYVLINFDSSTLANADEFAFTYTYFV